MSSPARYQFLDRLETGGVGVVFAAMDTTLQRKVAIKRLKGIGADDEALGNLQQETAILCRLHHPNIVRVLDFGLDGEGPYVVMDFLQGRTLHDWVRDEGALMEADFMAVARQTLEALVAAQAQHVLHRDLKPGNVMLNRLPSGNLHVTVVDFGLAKHVPRPMAQTAKISASVMGTVQFMAPEQFLRRPLDERTDLYSLGCVFYFALSRLYPFPGKETAEVIKAHQEIKPVPLENLRPDLPVALCRWVHGLMEFEPSARPAHAAAALEKLVQLQPAKTKAEGNSEFFYSADRPLPKVVSLSAPKPAATETAPPLNQPAPPRTPKPPPQRHWGPIAAIAALVIIGCLFWWRSCGSNDRRIGLALPRLPGKTEWYRRPLGQTYSEGVVWLRWEQSSANCWGLGNGGERAVKFAVTKEGDANEKLEVRALGQRTASAPFPAAAGHFFTIRIEFGSESSPTSLRIWLDPEGGAEPAAASALIDMELPEPLAFDSLLREFSPSGLETALVGAAHPDIIKP